MGEGDKVVEKEGHSAKADTNKKNPASITSTTGKTSQTHEEECLADGGAIMRDRVVKTTPLRAVAVANSTTMRQSVRRRRVSRPSQVDNSPATPQTLTPKIVAECLYEAKSELNEHLQLDQHLQLGKCMVCRLGCIQSHDVS